MEKLYINDNMLFKDKLPQELYITFQIIKILIRKENLNLIHNNITYQHYPSIFINSIITYNSRYTRFTNKEEKLIHVSFFIQETSYTQN